MLKICLLPNQNENVEDSVSLTFCAFRRHHWLMEASKQTRVCVQTAFQARWGEVFKVYQSKFLQHVLPSKVEKSTNFT